MNSSATRQNKLWPKHVSKSLVYPEEPAWWILFRNRVRYAKRPAIRFLDPETAEELQTFTYEEIIDACQAAATALLGAGIRPGERVAFLLPICPGLIVSYYATWLAGAIAVPCNSKNSLLEIVQQLRDSRPAALITTAAFSARLIDVVRQLGIRVFLMPVFDAMENNTKSLALRTDGQQQARVFSSVPTHPKEDVALLLYTGGTTGVPKSVKLSHYNLVVNTIQFATWYDFEEGGEVCISVLPLYHGGGIAGGMNVPLFSAATVLLLPHFDPAAVLRAIERYRATRCFGVPAMYGAIINAPRARAYDLSSLRACRSGAAPLPASIKVAFDELVGRNVLVEAYGITEMASITIANPIAHAKAGSVGFPVPDTDACVIDSRGYAVPASTAGELLVRGPQLMLGYWEHDQETDAVLVNGWLRTGDLAVVDEEGYFSIVGRLKDVIITAGYKVWPREIEEVLYQYPGVQAAAVVGISDTYLGEAVKAFVVFERRLDDKTATRDIMRHCRERLAHYKVPRQVEQCTQLPTSESGKLSSKLLRRIGDCSSTD